MFQKPKPYLCHIRNSDKEKIGLAIHNLNAFVDEYDISRQSDNFIEFCKFNCGIGRHNYYINLKTGRYKKLKVEIPEEVMNCELWYFDHQELYKTIDDKYIYVSHPYYNFDIKKMDQEQHNAYEAYIKFMKSLGYSVTILPTEKDWYNPKSTSAIIITSDLKEIEC